MLNFTKSESFNIDIKIFLLTNSISLKLKRRKKVNFGPIFSRNKKPTIIALKRKPNMSLFGNDKRKLTLN